MEQTHHSGKYSSPFLVVLPESDACCYNTSDVLVDLVIGMLQNLSKLLFRQSIPWSKFEDAKPFTSVGMLKRNIKPKQGHGNNTRSVTKRQQLSFMLVLVFGFLCDRLCRLLYFLLTVLALKDGLQQGENSQPFLPRFTTGGGPSAPSSSFRFCLNWLPA